jgi:hypothetical protein
MLFVIAFNRQSVEDLVADPQNYINAVVDSKTNDLARSQRCVSSKAHAVAIHVQECHEVRGDRQQHKRTLQRTIEGNRTAKTDRD